MGEVNGSSLFGVCVCVNMSGKHTYPDPNQTETLHRAARLNQSETAEATRSCLFFRNLALALHVDSKGSLGESFRLHCERHRPTEISAPEAKPSHGDPFFRTEWHKTHHVGFFAITLRLLSAASVPHGRN